MADITTHGAAGPSITTKDAVLETGASVTQSFAPFKAICAHLNAFHVYASDPSRAVEANHYCTHLSADVSIFPCHLTNRSLKHEWIVESIITITKFLSGPRYANALSMMRQRILQG